MAAQIWSLKLAKRLSILVIDFCLLLALSGHSNRTAEFPLSGVKMVHGRIPDERHDC